jgi:hypothetical protein
MQFLAKNGPMGHGWGRPGLDGVRSGLAFDLLIRPFVNVHCRTVVKYSLTTIFAAFVLLIGLSVNSRAADLVVSNNAIINIFGDSQFTDSSAPSTGFRFPDFLESYFQLNYPTSHIHVYNISRSGGTMDDRLTNSVQKNGIALWGYQFNNFQHIGISESTENGSLTSNQMYLAQSNLFQAPALMSDGGTNLVAHSGWAANHPVQWIGLGQIPGGASGDLGAEAVNDGGTNAGWTLGVRGVDDWHCLLQTEINDYVNNGGLSAGWFKGGHPGAGMELAMAFVFLRQITTDTNISTAAVDWNSASTVSTNHCVISSVNRNGNVLTFNRLDDRLPMAWDINPLMGITNDCMQAFVLDPTFADMFKFTIRVANLPAGQYAVLIDGQLAGVVPDTVLSSANGWNMFTNISGPYWAQRAEVLGRIRDKEHVDRYTRVPGSAGDQQGMVSYGSFANAYWSTNGRGDALINLLAPRVANVMALDALTAQAAQPTNHTFTIMPFAPTAIVKASASVNALNVPVILDGSASVKATNYYWEQVSPTLPQLDMIGQGTAKPMLISVTNAGTYTFRLTVDDGQTASSNQVTLTFVPPAGRTIFVDGQLTANCLNNNYSIANHNASGSDGNAYTTIQAAANATKPGDVVYIRAGLYTNAPAPANQNLVMLTVSGTATAPIRYENYNGEHVTLAGWGFSDVDTNGDGFADGPTYPAWRQTLFFVPFGIDYIQVKGLELTNSQQTGLNVEGRFCYAQECSTHDNWTAGAAITRARLGTNTICGTVFRWLEAYRNRHFDGLCFGLEDQQTFSFMSDCAIVDSVSYRNGYQPDGREVMPIGGDPQGGGNSDGLGATKYFADDASFSPQYGVRNWGTNLFIIRNILFNNCDDGCDISCAASLVEDNRSLFNGPTGTMGYKIFRPTQNMIYRGNVAYGNMGRGFEMRIDTNAYIQIYNNTSLNNQGQGFYISGTDARGTNNVAAYNGGPDWPLAQSPNWAADGGNATAGMSGNPMLLNTNVSLSSAFVPTWTVHQKHDYLEGQIRQALSPAVGSPLLGAGVLIQSYHCPRADNDANSPMLPSAPGRHWKQPAPNLGALDLQTTTGTPKPPTPTINSLTNL